MHTGSKVWLITGSSRGLGRAFAQAALDAGHRVVATARNPLQLSDLVSNAGYGNVCPVEDTSLADFRAQIETNLFGVIIMTKAALPYFRELRAGHIIQV